MISVICVYNNSFLLNSILGPSIERQEGNHEKILLDNTKGWYDSAARALNQGADQAHGDYLMFVHQDVEIPGTEWLNAKEKILNRIPDLGIAGPIGVSVGGNVIGKVCNCGHDYGEAVDAPTEVQTIDELCLIIPRLVFKRLRFDQRLFDGWHCYGADYCMSVRRLGLKPYVIPAYVYHRSYAQNTDRYGKYLLRLYRKHHQTVATTSGIASPLGYAVYSAIPVVAALTGPTNWWQTIRREIARSGCHSILDLGCGVQSMVRRFKVDYSLGVDIYEPYLEESRKKGIHSEYKQADIRIVDFPPRSFDAVFASEVVEHLEKKEGLALLDRAARWARKRVFITTPNGYLNQNIYDENPYQTHKSGWTVPELKTLGFRVYGMNGLKGILGEEGKPKYSPKFFWLGASQITNILTYYTPRIAFQLLGIKETDGKR